MRFLIYVGLINHLTVESFMIYLIKVGPFRYLKVKSFMRYLILVGFIKYLIVESLIWFKLVWLDFSQLKFVCYLVNFATRINCGSDVISHEICNYEILFRIILTNHIIQNNQINQVKLAHHRTDFGLVLTSCILIPRKIWLCLFCKSICLNVSFWDGSGLSKTYPRK